ncbi:MAG: superoxide dismutase, Fe-Mn family [Patescibacteria group bacterium]|nr:superoxide dismutase, Fe-Mn family [Patescibacteria group bacterium]
MKQFEEKKFDIGELKGLSTKTIEEHLKLYAGYVKHSNLIMQKIDELRQDSEKNAYALGEVQRRFGFEYNGMRNHEVYFDSLSDGAQPISESGSLYTQIENDFGSFQNWLTQFKSIAMTRGIGWAMLYWDRKDKRLLNTWVDEQHMGQLQDCSLILGLDMWEHSFVADYQPSGKKQYVEDYFANLNWNNTERNFQES